MKGMDVDKYTECEPYPGWGKCLSLIDINYRYIIRLSDFHVEVWHGPEMNVAAENDFDSLFGAQKAIQRYRSRHT